MKILVTGAAGFVGHHAVEHILKNTDWDIVVLDCLSYAATLNRITDISVFNENRVKFVWHDLRASISETIHNFIGPLDYVWHFAAESHVDRSLEDAIPFAMSNVVGTTNLLQYLRDYQKNIKKILVFSTDEVFGPAPEGVYFKEDDNHKPSNPYAASKSGEEMMAFSFAHAFKMPIAIVRSMNIIGERQHSEKFIPKIIKSILKQEPVILHGTDEKFSSRCWIHARNVADAMMFLTDKAEREEFYHIVGEEKTVFDLADITFHTIKGKLMDTKDWEMVDAHSQRPGHDLRYSLSGEKLKKMGWTPPKDLKESIIQTVKWTLKNQEWL